MRKYNDSRFDKRASHDCANDGTCGESIRDFRIGNSDIFFYDRYGRTIAQVPRLPELTPSQYYNGLYKPADSKTFYRDPEYIKEVLSNDFVFEHEGVRYVINYDNMSQQEQEQIRTDIKSAYDVYKAKFCISKSEDNPTVQIYIFNNKSDMQHMKLIPEFRNEQGDFLGITNGKKVLCYKASDLDNTLAHELGHVFQFRFSTAKVKALDSEDGQLMANAIGQEVEERNHKIILEQKGVDEYREFDGRFEFQYRGTTYDVRNTNLSKEEKDQLIQNIKSSHESLIREYHRLWGMPPHKNATVIIYADEDKGVEQIYYQNLGNTFTPLNKALISRSTTKEEEKEESNEVVLPEEQVLPEQKTIEEYNEFTGVFEFKYKGIKYNVQHKNYLSSEEEKAQFIYDIKNSHELLMSECYRLNGASSSQNVTIIIHVDANKKIDGILYDNPGVISSWLDKALISRSNAEEEVEEESNEVGQTILESEKESEGQKEEESNEVEYAGSEGQNKAEEEKSNQQETPQQHSGFLSNIIESVIGSIASFFSWVFGSYREEESTQQSPTENLSLLKFIDDDEPNYDAGKSYVDMLHKHNHYHSSDEFM